MDGGLHAIHGRGDFRVVDFTILGNHVHLIAEADGTSALANGVRALSTRLARGLNRMDGAAVCRAGDGGAADLVAEEGRAAGRARGIPRARVAT